MSEIEYIGVIEKDDKIADADQIVIYGAGKVGRHTLEILDKEGFSEKVCAIIDNNPTLVGKNINGIEICTVDTATRRYSEAIYLVASMSVQQMVESLLGNRISHIHIIRES